MEQCNSPELGTMSAPTDSGGSSCTAPTSPQPLLRIPSAASIKGRPACCVPGCTQPLQQAYNRKHRICRQHQRAAAFAVPGVEGAQWRFCSQCAKPEQLDCFDGDRRSCRVSSERHRQRRQAESAQRQQRQLEQQQLLQQQGKDVPARLSPRRTASSSAADEHSSPALKRQRSDVTICTPATPPQPPLAAPMAAAPSTATAFDGGELWPWLVADNANDSSLPSDAELLSIAAELGLDGWEAGCPPDAPQHPLCTTLSASSSCLSQLSDSAHFAVQPAPRRLECAAPQAAWVPPQQPAPAAAADERDDALWVRSDTWLQDLLADDAAVRPTLGSVFG